MTFVLHFVERPYILAPLALALGYLIGRGTHQRKLDRALKAYVRDDRPYLRRRP